MGNKWAHVVLSPGDGLSSIGNAQKGRLIRFCRSAGGCHAPHSLPGELSISTPYQGWEEEGGHVIAAMGRVRDCS